MRILSGQYKGRNLFSSKNLSIRPTTSKIKESIFNILQNFCLDKKVVDIFCGSGSLGLEALSRGAANVTFVEQADSSIKILEKNINHLNIDIERFKIIKKDALLFAKQTTVPYDLIFIDPPFYYPDLQKLVNLISQNKLILKDGLMIVEHEITNPLIKKNEFYKIIKQKKYGRSLISFIQAGEYND